MCHKLSLLFLLAVALAGNCISQSDSTTDPLKNHVFSLHDKVEREGRLQGNFNPDSTTTLPFGIIKELGSTRYIIAVDTAKYNKHASLFSACMAITFPGTDKRIAFAADGIRFNPKGVMGGAQARLMLVSDHSIDIAPNLKLRLTADGNNFVEWDCNGFKAVSLKGRFEFSPGVLFPDSTQTKEKVVSGSFQLYTNDIHNFITQINITPFCVRGLKDWSFSVTNATVDFSDLANFPGMVFPNDYPLTTPVWTGFYLQEAKVKLPPEISKTGTRTEIAANHLLIDNMGLSGFFKAGNIFGASEGSMNGWGFSVDELGVHFLCNKLNGGFLNGKVNIPVFDSTQAIEYSANIIYNPTRRDADYVFTISPKDNLKLSVFSAKVDLYPTSRVTVSKINGMFMPIAELNGKISFTDPKFSTDKLEFQDLVIISDKPYLKGGIFSFTGSSASKAAKYPVTINNLLLVAHHQTPKIGADITFNLMKESDRGISVGTKVLLGGRIIEEKTGIPGDVPKTVTKTKYKFDKVEIGMVNVEAATTVYSLRGMIAFKEGDPVYGSAFFGRLKFVINGVLKDTLTASVCFGHTTFKYWYADLRVPISIKLSPQISLTSIMGGMYYQMKPERKTSAEYIQLVTTGDVFLNSNAQRYFPDAVTSIGFKAGTVYKYTFSEKALNGDVMLEITLNEHGGLNQVWLDGNACMMSTVKERKTKAPPVSGSVMVQYDVPNKVFDADLKVNVDAYNAITGTGFGKIHLDPDVWFVCAGKPLNMLSVGLQNIASANAYFMVGNSLEPMAPVPAQVSHVVRDNGLENKRDANALSKASGFCGGVRFGSSFYKSFGWDAFSVYGGFAYGTGFDMMLANYGSNARCQGSTETVGVNGWVASGQLYIYLQGNIGAKGHIRFTPGCEKLCALDRDFDVTILSGTVAAVVSGKLPNPSYVSGRIGCSYSILGVLKGSFDFDYELGRDCAIISN